MQDTRYDGSIMSTDDYFWERLYYIVVKKKIESHYGLYLKIGLLN